VTSVVNEDCAAFAGSALCVTTMTCVIAATCPTNTTCRTSSSELRSTFLSLSGTSTWDLSAALQLVWSTRIVHLFLLFYTGTVVMYNVVLSY